LKAKFTPGSELTRLLLGTDDAYLLEHNSVTGRDTQWSDNSDGEGTNWLGLQLMILREQYRGGNRPWTTWLNQLIDLNTGKGYSNSMQEAWQNSVRAARHALVAKLQQQQPRVAICVRAGCGKPTFNGKPGEYCSRSCRDADASQRPFFGQLQQQQPSVQAICVRAGCGKPTFNGKPGEYCSKSCRDADASQWPSFGQLAQLSPFGGGGSLAGQTGTSGYPYQQPAAAKGQHKPPSVGRGQGQTGTSGYPYQQPSGCQRPAQDQLDFSGQSASSNWHQQRPTQAQSGFSPSAVASNAMTYKSAPQSRRQSANGPAASSGGHARY